MKGLRSLVVAVFAFGLVAATAIFWLGPENKYRPLPFAKPSVVKEKPPVAPDNKLQEPSGAEEDAPKHEPLQPPDNDDDGLGDASEGEAHDSPNTQDDAASPFADFSDSDRPMMPTDDPLCAQMPGRDSSIALIVKTGATESFGKIPTQLQTILRCVPDLLIFSDMEQTIAGVHVRDSLETVLDGVKQSPEFGLYRAQQDCLVSQGDCMRHSDKAKDG